MTQTSVAQTTTASDSPAARKRILVGSAIYNEITQFLYEEAALLDQQRFEEWTAMLAADLRYTAPLRSTRSGADQRHNVIYTTKHFDDDYASILGRLGRLRTKSAWAEDPPSRTRRMISNILVWERGTPNEYQVESYLLLARSRHEHPDYQFMSAVRNDVVRRVEGGAFQLACREIIIDQSVLGMQNFAVFL